MFTFLRLFTALFVLLFLSSCGAKRMEIFNNTTVMKHVGYGNKQTKIEEGVYLLAESGVGETHADLMKKLIRSAAKLTLSKGYRRFVIFPDDKGDEELEEALNKKRARKLYLKRIAKKSKDIGRARILTLSRNGIPVSKELFAVIVMRKRGRSGISAKRVEQALGSAVFVKKNGQLVTTIPVNPDARNSNAVNEFFKPRVPHSISR